MNYAALDDSALNNLARSRFGSVLKTVNQIGRDAVISELQFYDRVASGELAAIESAEIECDKKIRRTTKRIKFNQTA